MPWFLRHLFSVLIARQIDLFCQVKCLENEHSREFVVQPAILTTNNQTGGPWQSISADTVSGPVSTTARPPCYYSLFSSQCPRSRVHSPANQTYLINCSIGSPSLSPPRRSGDTGAKNDAAAWPSADTLSRAARAREIFIRSVYRLDEFGVEIDGCCRCPFPPSQNPSHKAKHASRSLRPCLGTSLTTPPPIFVKR